MTYDSKIHKRRSIRLKEYDYSQEGLYFVTICVNVGANGIRPHIFGEVINGEMVLNDVGKIVHNEWLKTSDIRSNVQLDAFIVMPNHVHGIIVITHDDRGVCDSDNQGVCDTPLRSPSNTVGAIVRGYKSAVTKQLRQLGHTRIIWQRNYFEHIIRNTKDCNNIFEYITNNPVNWKQDKFYMT